MKPDENEIPVEGPSTSNNNVGEQPPADKAPPEQVSKEDEDAMWDHLKHYFKQDDLNLMQDVLDYTNRKNTMGNCAGISITGSDLLKIRVGEWLNDTIVDAYMGLIKQRNASDPQLPRVCTLSCIFYDKYRTIGYNAVKRWCKNALEHDIIVMPMCDTSHWSMVIADMQLNQFIYYDSLVFPKLERLNAYSFYYCGILREFLLDDAKTKNLGEDVIEKIKSMDICSSCEPLQTNDYDCGVFMLYFAECYTRRSKILDFCQALMVQSRVRLFFEIVCGKIFDPYVLTSFAPVRKYTDTDTNALDEETKTEAADSSMNWSSVGSID